MKKFGIIVVIVGLIFISIKYCSDKNIEHAQKEKPVFKTSAAEIAAKGPKVTDFLNPYINQVISLDGIICEYYNTSDGQCFLQLTAGVQQDTCFMVYRSLAISELAEVKDWTACDSSMALIHNLHNLQEQKRHIFINVPLLYIEDAQLQEFVYSKSCVNYNRSYKRSDHHLENFCNNKVFVKAKLSSIKVMGDSTYLSFEDGILLGQERIKLKTNYKKRL